MPGRRRWRSARSGHRPGWQCRLCRGLLRARLMLPGNSMLSARTGIYGVQPGRVCPFPAVSAKAMPAVMAGCEQ